MDKNKKRIELLYVVSFSFHKKIMHAGGQSINFYFTQFHNSPLFSTSILSLGDEDTDLKEMSTQFDRSNIYSFTGRKTLINKIIDFLLINYIYNFFKKIIPFYYVTTGFYQRRLRLLLRKIPKDYKPDVIILEYTTTIFFINEIKSRFPTAKVVAACHDIIFQSAERKLKNKPMKWFNALYLKNLKKQEIYALSNADLISVPSSKDKNLILNNSLISKHKIHVIDLFYQNYSLKKSNKDSIVFYGYMAREENILAVSWFLDKVWPFLNTKFPNLKFCIVGGGADSVMENYNKEHKNVITTGFIKDPSIFFSNAYAMIVPLLIGAGVKVKSLEAMASGMVLITNSIGIEGICAIPEQHYLHAESPEDWIEKITRAIADEKLRDSISENAKCFVKQEFNLEKSFMTYSERISNL